MKLNKHALGVATGILWGVMIFCLTNYILIRGGAGESLSNLRNFYFGYSISFLGSIIGMIWGFVYGFVVGWLFALLYNFFVKPK